MVEKMWSSRPLPLSERPRHVHTLNVYNVTCDDGIEELADHPRERYDVDNSFSEP